MKVLQSYSHLVKFLPLIGFAAFYFDSSFIDLRLFFSRLDPSLVNTIYFIIFLGCITAVIGLLYIIHKSLKNNIKVLGNLHIFNKVIILSQSAIIGILAVTLIQYYKEGTYYFYSVSILLILSYGVGLIFMILSAIRFFSWYTYEKHSIILGYALATCVIIIFLISSMAYAAYELFTPYLLYNSSMDLTIQVSGKNPYPNIFSSLYYYSYIFTFLSIWSVTLLFLWPHLRKTKPLLFYLVLIIPLIYFLVPIVPEFSTYLARSIVQSPHYYGTLYLLFFSGTGPIGGVIFAAGLLLFARKFSDQFVKNCLLISALGMLFFFIVNQDPPLVEILNPPFGLISKSFVGLSCYMIFLGFYSIVIYLSRKDTIANAVLKEVSKDKLFGSLIRSEQERQVSAMIDRSMETLQENQQMESKEMSLEDINNLIMMVRKEIATHRKNENHK